MRQLGIKMLVIDSYNMITCISALIHRLQWADIIEIPRTDISASAI